MILKKYTVNVTDERVVVSFENADVLEINLDDKKVATTYVVNFSDTSNNGIPVYSKSINTNGIEDIVYVEKDKLSPNDMISSLEMNKDYLFLAVYKEDDITTTPYYIKLPE